MHYFISYTVRSHHPHDRRGWTPRSCVSDIHPFTFVAELCRKLVEEHGMEAVLVSWQPITPEEHALYLRTNDGPAPTHHG